MATAIRVPDIGTTVDRVKLIRWLKDEGETVRRGEPLCELETDKATSDLESVAEGTLLKQLAAPGAEIEQGAVIAYVGEPDEKLPFDAKPGAEKRTAGGPKRVGRRGDGPKIPPIIRNIANKEGVDLDLVVGTGPGGRITREDVYRARAGGRGRPANKSAGGVGKPLSDNQLIVARRVTRSLREKPTISLNARVDMGGVIRERRRLRAEGKRIGYDAFIIASTASVMRDFPHFRSTVVSEKVFEREEVVIAVAISRGYELYTPVVRGADGLSVWEVEEELLRLRETAESQAFTPDDFAGATVTVSNLGMYPIRDFTAVIPPDQIAIVSVGRIEETSLAAVFTLSVDHRLINGREAAEFLTALKKSLEERAE